ncbi:hypothetical protein Tco_1241144 [Tanacetum coccineum]
MRIEESLSVTFDESLPEPKSSPLVEDDRINEPIVQDLNGSPSLQVNVLDEDYPKILKITLGWLLEEIHVTWDHLEKKRTRLQLYTKSLEEYAYSAWRRRHILL